MHLSDCDITVILVTQNEESGDLYVPTPRENAVFSKSQKENFQFSPLLFPKY